MTNLIIGFIFGALVVYYLKDENFKNKINNFLGFGKKKKKKKKKKVIEDDED